MIKETKFIFLRAAPAGVSGCGSLEPLLWQVQSSRPLMPDAALRGVPKSKPPAIDGRRSGAVIVIVVDDIDGQRRGAFIVIVDIDGRQNSAFIVIAIVDKDNDGRQRGGVVVVIVVVDIDGRRSGAVIVAVIVDEDIDGRQRGGVVVVIVAVIADIDGQRRGAITIPSSPRQP